MHEGVEAPVPREPAPLRELMDPTLPVPGEVRADSDGDLWEWVPSHHSKQEEADIATDNTHFWERHLAEVSDDAEADVEATRNGRRETADYAPEEIAYRWKSKGSDDT